MAINPKNVDLPPSAVERTDGTVVLPPMAILDSHEFDEFKKDATGRPVLDPVTGKPIKMTVRLHEERLERMAQKINRKMANGTPGLIIYGHTSDHLPEKDQPDVIGMMGGAAVLPLTNPRGDVIYDSEGRPKKAIWITPIAHPGAVPTFQNCKYSRSVELWLDQENPEDGGDGDDIAPLALLKSTAPRRDLPMHQLARDTFNNYHRKFSRDSHTSALRYERTFINEEPDMANDSANTGGGTPPRTEDKSTLSDADCKKICDMIMQSEPMARITKALPILEELMSESGGAAGGAPGAGDQSLLEPLPPSTTGEGHRGAPDKMMGCSTAGPGNATMPTQMAGFTPAPGDYSHATMASAMHSPAVANITPQPPNMPHPASGMGGGPNQYARVGQQQPILSQQPEPNDMSPEVRAYVVKFQQDQARLQQQVNQLQAEKISSDVALELQALQAEPNAPDFVAAEETPVLVKMNREERMKRYQFMRDRYKPRQDRLPNGGGMPVPDGQQIDPAMLAAIKFQRPALPGGHQHPQQQPQHFSNHEDVQTAANEAARRRNNGSDPNCTWEKILMERQAGSTNGPIRVH